MNASKRLLWLLALAPLLLVGLLVWRFAGPEQVSAEQLRQRGFWLEEQAPRLKIPQLSDHRGGQFSAQNLQGRWSFVFFGYTHCPDICGPSVALMARTQEAMQQRGMDVGQVQMLMVSVDPKHDSAERMASFLSRFGPSLLGLLPDKHQLLAVAIPLHAVYSDGEQPGLMNHSGNIALIDPAGRYLGHFRPPMSVDSLLGVFEQLRDQHAL